MSLGTRELRTCAVALLLAGPAAFAPAAAQEEPGSGLAALEFPVGARPLGMGRAFVASSGDLQGLLYNPAGPASRDVAGFTFSRYQGASDLDLNGNFGAFSFPLLAGAATIAVHFEDLGEFEVTGSSPEPLGSEDLRNLLLVGSYALEVRPGLAVGGSVKYLSSDLGVADGNGFAFDAGALLRTAGGVPLSIGVAVLNVGPDITFELDDGSGNGSENAEGEGDPLPSRLRWGAALDVGHLLDPSENYGLALAGDAEHDLRELGNVSLFGGVAIDYRDLLILRGGLLRLDNAFEDESSSGASFGAGVHWQRLHVDIARELGVNELGDETHFSLGVDF